MNREIIVVDGFFEDPDRIREEALRMEFDTEGNYPGMRTIPLTEGGVLEHLEKLMDINIDRERWNGGEYTGTYQYVLEETPTWVHADRHNDWSCVVFLHPNPEPNSGTSFYKHISTGSRMYSDNDGEYIEGDGDRWDRWLKTDTVSNVFNRAVIFKGELWHAADEYFGKTKKDARLFQTFFFSEVM
jgi:hypothetical protein